MKFLRSRNIFFILAVLLVANLCMAETIIEKFKPDSVLTKVTEPNSGCAFTYSPEGYTACTVRRSNLVTTAGKYFRPLSQNYYMPDISSNATVSDLWFGFDFKYDEGSSGVAAGYIGIFNSEAGNGSTSPSQLNSIGIMPYDLDKFSIRSVSNSGDGGASLSETGIGTTLSISGTYRCKIHVYISGSDTLADVDVYSVDSLNQTTLAASLTGATVASGTTFWSGTNALGVRNITGPDNASKSVFYVDNMYFSTAGVVADVNLSAPGWLVADDPVSLEVDNLEFSEKFRPNPCDTNEWEAFAQIGSGTGYYYDANGFYYCATRRKNTADSVAALYKPLGVKLYEPYNLNGYKLWSTDEMWYGFDYQFVSGTTGTTFAIGLFNEQSSNLSSGSGQNSIGLEFHSAYAVAMRAIGNVSWATLYQSEPTIGYYSGQYDSYRFTVRIYANELTDSALIDVVCYKFDVDGVLSETPEFTATGVVAADGTLGTPQKFLEGMNAFGIRNASGSSAGPTRFNVDNMYFSTEAPLEFGPPSWIIKDADLNADKVIDLLDLKVLADNWLSEINLQGDLNDSGRVEFGDYAEFSNYWGL